MSRQVELLLLLLQERQLDWGYFPTVERAVSHSSGKG
jgi:hypothetical protein